MKKFYFLIPIFIIVLFLFSCEKISFGDKYIDLDVDHIKSMNSVQLADYKEASKRLEKHLIPKDNKLVLNIESANEVNISNRLFKYMANQLDNFNILYEKLSKENSAVIEISRYHYIIISPNETFNFIKVKGGGEEESDNATKGEHGGITSIEVTPYSLVFNISNATISIWRIELEGGAAVGFIVTEYIATYFPELVPTVGAATTVVTGVAGLLALGADVLSSQYPNGLSMYISTTGITIIDLILSGIDVQVPDK